MRIATRWVVCWVALAAWMGTADAAPKRLSHIVRGIYAHPRGLIDARVWAGYGKGYEFDKQEKHSGEVSIRCTNDDDKSAQGAGQTVIFNQDKPRPLVVAGWAKLEGVSGKPSYRCSVYLDLRLKGGKGWPMKIAAFDPANKGWQYVEKTYEPPAPIESARVYVFLRQSKGTAWFDDIYVGQIVDDKGTRSPNLLKAPSFENNQTDMTGARDEFYDKLKSIGCNTFHFYRSVGWDTLMATKELPKIEPDDQLLGFVNDAHKRGFKVWLTVGAPAPPIKDANSKYFPFYGCVNGLWGDLYTRAIAYFAQYGVDGIGMVPDEWTSNNGRVKRGFAKHKDPKVAEFYKKLPTYCDCPICRDRFKKRYGLEYPAVARASMWSTNDPAWPRLVEFRYDSTSAWMQRNVEAAKRINPNIITDTMICVLPVCSDNRIYAGAAWDKIGVDTQLDCLQTDPYIFLHNYRGDSTHYYATETALHLTAANWQRWSGVTIEACRLRDKYRHKEPAEVYGAALSCLAHGAREFFWWHFVYIQGKVKHVDPEPPARRVAAAYDVMQKMEPYVLDAAAPGDVLVLYSRNSEDAWDRLAPKKLLPPQFGEELNAKRGFIAHKNALYWLLRRGYPLQMTFIDNPNPVRLANAKVAVVPFPLALKESEVETIEAMARAGKTVVLLSELSPLDELGRPLKQPRLLRLFGDAKPDRTAAGPVAATLGKGKVVFFGDDAAVKLFEPVDKVKDPKAKVPLAAFDAKRTAALERTLTEALGRPGSALAAQPAIDIEATVLDGSKGRLLLAINWDSTRAAGVAFRPEVTRGFSEAVGWRIDAKSQVTAVRIPIAAGGLSLTLAAQDAVLMRLK